MLLFEVFPILNIIVFTFFFVIFLFVPFLLLDFLKKLHLFLLKNVHAQLYPVGILIIRVLIHSIFQTFSIQDFTCSIAYIEYFVHFDFLPFMVLTLLDFNNSFSIKHFQQPFRVLFDLP